MKKKRSSKRRSFTETTVHEMTKALKALPMPARAILNKHIRDLDEFRQTYPRLYDVMFKNVSSKDSRRIERRIERVQRRDRNQ